MSIIVNDSIKVSKTNTPTRDGERISSLAQMSSIATPFVGMRVYVENTGKEYVVTGLAKARINGVTVEDAVVDTYEEVAQMKDVQEKVANAVEAEKERAEAAEGSLSNKIQQEKNEILNNLEAVEENLANNIATEEERATEAEQMLRESLQAHSAANIDAFAAVQSRHDEFVLEANRKNGELATAITTEVAKEQQRAKSVEEELRTTKADEVGYHKKMTVGFADNLVGRGEATNNMFTFRATGDTASVEDGSARLEKIKGNTIVWNQLAQIKSGLSNNMVLFTNNGDGSYNVVTDIDAKSAANTYFEIANVENCEGEKLLIFGAPATATSASYCLKTDDGHTICGNGAIVTSTMAYNRVYIFVAKEVAINSIVVFKPQVFNLTRMFGPGNEPATIAEFRKLFPEEYYSYNDGEMQSFIAEAIETTGFNQWDEEWALGVITNGADKASNRNILSKNYIPIVQGYDYYLKAPYGIYLACYDKEKKFIGNYTKNDSAGWVHPNTIIVSSKLQPGTCFVRFHVTTSYGATYKNDICINISHSGYRNGEYKKYEKFVRTLPVARYFPDGMRSAGDVRDELTAHEATTRVGVRAYAAGDENDSAVTTDGTKSCYALPEPMVVRIDEPLNLDYEVCDFGTEKIIGNNVPVKADIVYGFNAVDTIRSNRLSIEDLLARVAALEGKV